MGLRDVLHAIWDYPRLRQELEQLETTLEVREQEWNAIYEDSIALSTELDFLEKREHALVQAIRNVVPDLNTLEQQKKLYEAAAPYLDPEGYDLYGVAGKITGFKIHHAFPTEDNLGRFEFASGYQMMPYLEAYCFGDITWEPIQPGYEFASEMKINTGTPEYQSFQKELYSEVLQKLGLLETPKEQSQPQMDDGLSRYGHQEQQMTM